MKSRSELARNSDWEAIWAEYDARDVHIVSCDITTQQRSRSSSTISHRRLNFLNKKLIFICFIAYCLVFALDFLNTVQSFYQDPAANRAGSFDWSAIETEYARKLAQSIPTSLSTESRLYLFNIASNAAAIPHSEAGPNSAARRQELPESWIHNGIMLAWNACFATDEWAVKCKFALTYKPEIIMWVTLRPDLISFRWRILSVGVADIASRAGDGVLRVN